MDYLTIGEFSKATGLTVKSLRFYQDKGILIPGRIDSGSGYRYYNYQNFETAKMILILRGVGFPLDRIREILTNEALLEEQIQQRRKEISMEIQMKEELLKKLDIVIGDERKKRKLFEENPFSVERRQLSPMLIAGVQMEGRYSEMGQGFSLLGRTIGQHIVGPAQCLYHDEDHRDEDANFEPFFPIANRTEADGISVRELPGGQALCLKHLGPYEDLGRSYSKLFIYAREHDLTWDTPSREVFLKGPSPRGGGNPNEYLTELQFLVKPA